MDATVHGARGIRVCACRGAIIHFLFFFLCVSCTTPSMQICNIKFRISCQCVGVGVGVYVRWLCADGDGVHHALSCAPTFTDCCCVCNDVLL